MLRMLVGAGNNVQQDNLVAELGVAGSPLASLVQPSRRVLELFDSATRHPRVCSYFEGFMVYGVTTFPPGWAGAVMQTLRQIRYPHPIDCNQAHPIDVGVFRVLKRSGLQGTRGQMWEGLHISPRLGP